jgi:uncharacterized protein (DUF1697 family)
MKTYVALFRGLNVGGKGVLPMKELAAILEDLGLRAVGTYIQSGNAVFRGEEKDASLLSHEIGAAIEKRRGFEPQVIVLEPGELEKAVASNPFPEAEPEPKTLHVYFLASIPERPDLDALEGTKGYRERFALKDDVFYLHAPDGVGRSKLAASAEKLLGVPATARNWRTVCKVLEMAKERN